MSISDWEKHALAASLDVKLSEGNHAIDDDDIDCESQIKPVNKPRKKKEVLVSSAGIDAINRILGD